MKQYQAVMARDNDLVPDDDHLVPSSGNYTMCFVELVIG